MSLAHLRVLRSIKISRLTGIIPRNSFLNFSRGSTRCSSTGVGGADFLTGEPSILPDIEVRSLFKARGVLKLTCGMQPGKLVIEQSQQLKAHPPAKTLQWGHTFVSSILRYW